VATYTPPNPAGGAGSATHRTAYTYNADRQLDLVALPGGRSIDYQYDAAGRLSGIVLAANEHRRRLRLPGATRQRQSVRLSELHARYNQGLLTSVTWSGGGQANGSVEYGYDNDLRISSVSVNGANSVSYGYDNDSLLTTIGALTIARPAAPAAPLVSGTTLTTPGVTLADSFTYNTLGELTATRTARVAAPATCTR